MNNSDFSNDPAKAAQEQLLSFEAMSSKGLLAGTPPKSFCVTSSIWAGAIACLMGTPYLLICLFAGCIVFYFWKKKQDAWVAEIRTKKDLNAVMIYSCLIGMLFLFGYFGLKFYRLAWAPCLAGGCIAFIQYQIMKKSYGKFWEERKPADN